MSSTRFSHLFRPRLQGDDSAAGRQEPRGIPCVILENEELSSNIDYKELAGAMDSGHSGSEKVRGLGFLGFQGHALGALLQLLHLDGHQRCDITLSSFHSCRYCAWSCPASPRLKLGSSSTSWLAFSNK